jgi:hypothetical protein
MEVLYRHAIVKWRRPFSRECLEEAYAGLGEANLTKMSVALREPDYGELIPGLARQTPGKKLASAPQSIKVKSRSKSEK